MPEFTFVPAHTHDCTECTYLGTGNYMGNAVDVYLSCGHSVYKYIARFGEDGDYTTVADTGTLLELCEKIANDLTLKVRRLNVELANLMREREELMDRVYKITVEIEDKIRMKC